MLKNDNKTFEKWKTQNVPRVLGPGLLNKRLYTVKKAKNKLLTESFYSLHVFHISPITRS